jgi:hypothetical protein
MDGENIRANSNDEADSDPTPSIREACGAGGGYVRQDGGEDSRDAL